MKLSVEVSDKLRRRIKKQTDLTKRPALHEAAMLIEEAVDMRETGLEAVRRDERERCASVLEAMAATYLPGGPMDAKGGLLMGATALRSGRQR